MSYTIFEELESNVRSYSRTFPISFSHAKKDILIDVDGNKYIDFFAGAGAINFGHNNPEIKKAILDYLAEDHIIHALDMFTSAKEEFLSTLNEKVLKPRNLNYKIMSCGPTGTNAVEAALKLARKNKKRFNVFSFTGAFHGMSLGSLALTSNIFDRHGGGTPLNHVVFMPYFNAFKDPMTSIEYLENVLTDDHSGVEKPAAIVLETVQAEGGINVAPVEWLKAIRRLCDEHDILMIVDDIQVGVGRTGTFFSFERAGIVPDMVILSKSISGFGLPLSLLLMKPELDIFEPAEHNGTFRGNQLGFVGCKKAMELYEKDNVDGMVAIKEKMIEEYLEKEILPISEKISYRGIGMIWGIDFSNYDIDVVKAVQNKCVEKGLIIERAGRHGKVLKLLPSLYIEEDNLVKGLNIIKESMQEVL